MWVTCREPLDSVTFAFTTTPVDGRRRAFSVLGDKQLRVIRELVI